MMFWGSEIVVSATLDLVSESKIWKLIAMNVGPVIKAFQLQSSHSYLPEVPHRGVVITQFQNKCESHLKALFLVSCKLHVSPKKLLFLPIQLEGISSLSLQTPPPPWPFSMSTETLAFSTLKLFQLPGDYTLASQKFIPGKDLRNKPPSSSLRRGELSPPGLWLAQSGNEVSAAQTLAVPSRFFLFCLPSPLPLGCSSKQGQILPLYMPSFSVFPPPDVSLPTHWLQN